MPECFRAPHPPPPSKQGIVCVCRVNACLHTGGVFARNNTIVAIVIDPPRRKTLTQTHSLRVWPCRIDCNRRRAPHNRLYVVIPFWFHTARPPSELRRQRSRVQCLGGPGIQSVVRGRLSSACARTLPRDRSLPSSCVGLWRWPAWCSSPPEGWKSRRGFPDHARHPDAGLFQYSQPLLRGRLPRRTRLVPGRGAQRD